MKDKKVIMKAKSVYSVIASEFNKFITERLLEGCLDELKRFGITKKNITVTWVPGAFEVPLAALKQAKKKSVCAVITLGAVIRGETLHFELVAENAARGIAQVSFITEKPVIFGILTTENLAQAKARSSDKAGDHKGREAARAAVDMVKVLKHA